MSVFSKTRGFTLIEVLVAMAIVSIALAAILLTMHRNLALQSRIKEKMLASMIADKVVAMAHMQLIHPPYAPDVLSSKTTWLNQHYAWKIQRVKTPDPAVDALNVFIKNASGSKQLFSVNAYMPSQI